MLSSDDQDVKIIACPIFSVKTEKGNNKLSRAFSIVWQNMNENYGRNQLYGSKFQLGVAIFFIHLINKNFLHFLQFVEIGKVSNQL